MVEYDEGVIMAASTPDQYKSWLESDPIGRIRRNHGLEHATLHLLSKRYPRQSLAGHSSLTGFWILGDVSTDDLRSAVSEALQRLKNGESSLAVHPNCGTNIVTSGLLAGLAGGLAMFSAGKRLQDKLERLPMAMMLATLTIILSKPLGNQLQERLTTSAEPGNLRVVKIIATKRGRLKAHRVVTQG
jgi:hypothetical protein